MRKLLFVVLCPVAVLALALLVGGAAGGNGNGHGNRSHGSFKSGQTGYHFLVFDAVSGTTDRMIIQGDGSFNANQAHGGGTFDHFQTGATLLWICSIGILNLFGIWSLVLGISVS